MTKRTKLKLTNRDLQKVVATYQYYLLDHLKDIIPQSLIPKIEQAMLSIDINKDDVEAHLDFLEENYGISKVTGTSKTKDSVQWVHLGDRGAT